jgi:inner membrane transporter RhtA
VGAIEFLGTVLLAAVGARTRRNLLALGLAVGGVAALTDVRLTGQPLGFVFAFANCAGFMLYVVLGHRIANTTPDDEAGRDRGGLAMCGIDQLGAAMARLPRATFALMLAILPATATGIGLVVLGQVPTVQDLLGIALVVAGVALHHDP